MELAVIQAGYPGGVTPEDLPTILGSDRVLDAIADEIEALRSVRLSHEEIERILRGFYEDRCE